eukprot:Clim_evm38s147 gene=Clim_evmTU38s147
MENLSAEQLNKLQSAVSQFVEVNITSQLQKTSQTPRSAQIKRRRYEYQQGVEDDDLDISLNDEPVGSGQESPVTMPEIDTNALVRKAINDLLPSLISEIQKRKKLSDVSESEIKNLLNEAQDRQRTVHDARLNKEEVEIVADHTEVYRRVTAFMELCSKHNAESNEVEYTAAEDDADVENAGSARTRPRQNDSGPRIKVLSSEQIYGPLSKTTNKSIGQTRNLRGLGATAAMDDRLRMLEDAAGLHYKEPPVNVPVYERLKAIEKRLLVLESATPGITNLHAPGKDDSAANYQQNWEVQVDEDSEDEGRFVEADGEQDKQEDVQERPQLPSRRTRTRTVSFGADMTMEEIDKRINELRSTLAQEHQ